MIEIQQQLRNVYMQNEILYFIMFVNCWKLQNRDSKTNESRHFIIILINYA